MNANPAFVGLFELPPNTLTLFASRSPASMIKHDIVDYGDAACWIEHVLTSAETQHLRELFDQHPQVPVDLYGRKQPFLDQIGSYRSSFYHTALAELLWQRIAPLLPDTRVLDDYAATDQHGIWKPVGINPLFRMIGYRENGFLLPHYDAGYDFGDDRRHTLMSVVFYLNEEADIANGGHGDTQFMIESQRHLPTRFRDHQDWLAAAKPSQVLYVQPAREGAALIFDHRLPHEATPSDRARLVLRTDIIFERLDMPVSEKPPAAFPLHHLLSVQPGTSTQAVDQAFTQISPEHYVAWKILRDPIYARAYEVLGNTESLIEGGFLDGALDVGADDPHFMSTPLYKIQNHLDHAPLDKPLVVLCITGAMCPMHDGHIAMMEMAKKTLEAKGMTVLGGYVSPSHQDYVGEKCGTQAMSLAERLSWCDDMLRDHPWLMVDPWESSYHSGPINFTDVILRLGRYLSTHLHSARPIRVHYVFGGDNAKFALAFAGMGHAVCVPRPGYRETYEKFKQHPRIASNPHIVFVEPSAETINLSSSDIRRSTPQHRKRSEHFTLNLRDEGLWAHSHWKDKVEPEVLQQAHQDFVKDLVYTLKKHFKQGGQILDVKIQTLSEQQATAQQLLSGHQVISLDPCLPGDYQLAISRGFQISARQGHSIGVARPGAASLAEQWASIPSGEYVLFDDDMATQKTKRFVMSQVPEHIKILLRRP